MESFLIDSFYVAVINSPKFPTELENPPVPGFLPSKATGVTSVLSGLFLLSECPRAAVTSCHWLKAAEIYSFPVWGPEAQSQALAGPIPSKVSEGQRAPCLCPSFWPILGLLCLVGASLQFLPPSLHGLLPSVSPLFVWVSMPS